MGDQPRRETGHAENLLYLDGALVHPAHDDPTSPEGGAPMLTFETTIATMTGGADLGVALDGPLSADRCH
jgi:hypothetical protein